MARPLSEKSTVEQIRRRFDADVERFSVLETGQQAAMDAPVILDVVARSAAGHLPPGGALLDLGCGAGNFTLRVLDALRARGDARPPGHATPSGRAATPPDCTLVDLSRPMLDRAAERVSAATAGRVETVQSDMRALSFGRGRFDVILAGQVLHHLRDDADWEAMFARLHRWLRPGGVLFVADLIAHDDPAVQAVMQARYAEHLEVLGGPAYRDKVLAYCDEEDSPRSVRYQFGVLAKTGFGEFDVLHQNALFTAYYAKR